jgi:L-fucose mutarotase/ribose pyranase (RbsD/FucU family)
MRPASSLPLFEALEPVPAPASRADRVTLADLVEQIKRDTEAAREGWPPGPTFYLARIAAYREAAKTFAEAQSTR